MSEAGRESPAVADGATLHPDEPPAPATPVTPRSEKTQNQMLSANQPLNAAKSESDEDGFADSPPPPRGPGGGYWRQAGSRPHSPSTAPAITMANLPDNASEASSMMPIVRPKSRAELATSRYSNLSYWRARRVVFYKNGDPFFPGVEFRFKPGRDIGSIESLLDKLSLRMDLPRGARYIFSMDGDRKYRLDELEDGASYVVSSYKTFKVSARACPPLPFQV